MSSKLIRLSINPKRIMSLMRRKPDPKTIAFGGVPTGIMKAKLAPSVNAIAKGTNGSPVCWANMPTTGINKVTMARLESTSEINMAKVVNIKMAETRLKPSKDSKVLAKYFKMPFFSKTAAKAKPPPNNSKIPHGSFSVSDHRRIFCFPSSPFGIKNIASAPKIAAFSSR